MASIKKYDDPNKMIETLRKAGNNKRCFDCEDNVNNILIIINFNYYCRVLLILSLI